MRLDQKIQALQTEYPNKSMAEIVGLLSDGDRAILFADFTEEDFARLKYDADFWLRPKQKIPTSGGDWFVTALIAGRGFGKTRTMSEWARKYAKENPGCRIGIAGRTASDVRDILVLGESGILAVSPEDERPEYKQQQASLFWPNGSSAKLLSSEVPDSARGNQFHAVLCDELAAWKTTRDSSGANLYSNIVAATRLGDKPRILVATTPKKSQFMKELMAKAKDPKEKIKLITGSTFENSSLSGFYIDNLKRDYGDTDLAKQELEGLMLEDSEGIVFTDEMFNAARENSNPPAGLVKIIAIDPTVAQNPEHADECGIMVIGATRHVDPRERTAYLLEDVSLKAPPERWAQVVADTARRHGIVHVVAERNQGGDLIRSVIQAKNERLKVHTVWAAKGKVKRVEPVAIAMQQGRIKLSGEFPELEDQLSFYDPEMSGYSPDRMDAFAWGMTALLVDQPPTLHFGTIKAKNLNKKLPTTMKDSRQNRLPRNIRR